MFNIFSAKKNKMNTNLFNSYKSGLIKDTIREDEERYEEEKNNVYSYDEYISRMNARKSAIQEETEKSCSREEDRNIKLCMYRSNKAIIDMWKAIEEELSQVISMGVTEGETQDIMSIEIMAGLPRKIYVEFQTENHNVTAIITRNSLTSSTNERDIIYTSKSYEIPGEFDEEVVARVLTDLCEESLYGRNLSCIL